jgi:hypothetical protein
MVFKKELLLKAWTIKIKICSTIGITPSLLADFNKILFFTFIGIGFSLCWNPMKKESLDFKA